MAKQIKRFGLPMLIILGLAGAVFVGFAPSGDGDPPPPPLDGDPEFALEIRHQLGFGPHDVLPALAGVEGHTQMILAALAYTAQESDNAGLNDTVGNYGLAEKSLFHEIAWNQNQDQAFDRLHGAQGATMDFCIQLIQSMAGGLEPQHFGLVTNVIQNRKLDSELRTLNLNQLQRQAILAAGHERDMVTRNAGQWYEPDVLAEARAAYEQTLQSILSAQQSAELAEIRTLLEQRQAEMAETEAQFLGLPAAD